MLCASELLGPLPLESSRLSHGGTLWATRGERGRVVESAALVLAALLVECVSESWVTSLLLVRGWTAFATSVLSHE